jgi:hypothetical protein
VVGTHTTAAFAVKGRVVKRIDLRSQGRASITVRFLGASSAKHRAGYLGILGPRGPVTTLAEDLAPGVVRFLNLDPGTYNLRSYLGTALGFGATPVTVAAGGRAVVDVVLVPCGQLVLEGIDPKTGFAVHDSSTGRAIPTDLFYRRNDMSLIARIPQGTYRIEVADQPARDAVVGATETIVDFGGGRPK